MRLLLRRDIKSKVSTIGKLFVNGSFQCFILEDRDRGLLQKMQLTEIVEKKIKGQTAIPEGEYEVILTFSNRFQKVLPLLKDVPGFAGIRIHCGNTVDDTEGCLITGSARTADRVLSSRAAFDILMASFHKAISNQEKITIKIESIQ